jgi:hypothetical protein
MAITYSSWEYSQGPTLYIDSSGFESIDEDKNFVYYYIVTYGPVEYRRKATDEKGASTYEYKYSFGLDLAARKVLNKFTFSGKNQLTKTVTHEVTEEGFKKSITKTFVIDTNIESNLNTNTQVTINPNYKIDLTNWAFENNAKPPGVTNPTTFGWFTTQSTGYTTETYYVTESYVERTYTEWVTYTYYEYEEHYCTVPGCNDVHTSRVQKTGRRQVTRYVYGYRQVKKTRQVPYNISKLINSFCTLNLKAVREKINDYEKYSSVVFMLKTATALNKPPTVSMITNRSTKANKTQLTPKSESSISSNGLIEYYIPMDLLNSTYKNYDSIEIMIEKGSCSAANATIIEGYAFIEIEADAVPYINLMVQAYDRTSGLWNTCCVIPYLNYQEIEDMRASKQHISKNLFFPSDLPKTDANYRIQLDTNLVAQEAERLTNFRIDILSDQLIQPGSMSDRTLFINNDSLEYPVEVDVDTIDEIKLNVLGFSTHTQKPYAGFLKQGANEVHAYLKNSVRVVEEGIHEDDISENEFYNHIVKTNGDWLSNNVFAANSFDLGQISILQGNNLAYEDDLITFKMPYNFFKSNANYTFIFHAYAEDSFSITEVATVDAADESKIIKSKIYAKTNADPNKLKLVDYEKVLYSPPYKLKRQNETELISEENLCERNVEVRIEFNTGNIDKNDSKEFELTIKRFAIKNIFIKNFQCLCIDENDNKFVDVTEPYGVDVFTDRQFDTFITMYYDGFHLEHINPMLYRDMVYLRNELDNIRNEYTLQPYPWTEWTNTYDAKGNLIVDEFNNAFGVEENQPIRASHFNDVKNCCVSTYEELLALRPPVGLNTSPTQFREGTGLIPLNDEDPTQGYVLQHYKDKLGNEMDVDKYFPEWRQIINLINRN